MTKKRIVIYLKITAIVAAVTAVALLVDGQIPEMLSRGPQCAAVSPGISGTAAPGHEDRDTAVMLTVSVSVLLLVAALAATVYTVSKTRAVRETVRLAEENRRRQEKLSLDLADMCKNAWPPEDRYTKMLKMEINGLKREIASLKEDVDAAKLTQKANAGTLNALFGALVESVHVEDPAGVVREMESEPDGLKETLCTPLRDLNLNARVLNALESHGIGTVGTLCSCSRRQIREMENFGKKSIGETDRLLERYGLRYGMDLSGYGYRNVFAPAENNKSVQV